jgi:hypothetical protein
VRSAEALVVTARGRIVHGGLEPVQRSLVRAAEARAGLLVLNVVAGMELRPAAYRRLGTRLRLVARRDRAGDAALKDTGLAHTPALHSSAPTALAGAAPEGAL